MRARVHMLHFIMSEPVLQFFFTGVTATMVLSGFGPYRCMWHWCAPTKCIGVIHTPRAVTHALGLGAVHGVGEHHAPPHKVFIVICVTRTIWGDLEVYWQKGGGVRWEEGVRIDRNITINKGKRDVGGSYTKYSEFTGGLWWSIKADRLGSK